VEHVAEFLGRVLAVVTAVDSMSGDRIADGVPTLDQADEIVEPSGIRRGENDVSARSQPASDIVQRPRRIVGKVLEDFAEERDVELTRRREVVPLDVRVQEARLLQPVSRVRDPLCLHVRDRGAEVVDAEVLDLGKTFRDEQGQEVRIAPDLQHSRSGERQLLQG